MKKIAVVGTVGIPACYGGFESLVNNLTSNASSSVKYTVFCSGKSYSQKMNKYNGADLVYLPLNANGVQSVPYDILSLIKCWFIRPDVVLILGVSGCLFLPLFKLLSPSKVITNIDGLEWRRDKWGVLAKKFLKLSEAIAVKFSDVVVTDNEAISNYVIEEYGVNSATIAYGGDHALRDIKVTPAEEEYALGLCRIEPENNITMILESFSKTNKLLKFIGNWDSSEFGRSLRDKYSKYDNIKLLDPIYDIDELYKIRHNCSMYIHGHSAGGTNPSLVEMMHFDVPVMAFDCNFNRYSTCDQADYFSNSSELKSLVHSLKEEELRKNAIAMKTIAQSKYTWDEIALSYEKLYK